MSPLIPLLLLMQGLWVVAVVLMLGFSLVKTPALRSAQGQLTGQLVVNPVLRIPAQPNPFI